jgi:hypothetical protein
VFAACRTVDERVLAAYVAHSRAPLIHVHNGPDRLMRHAVKGAHGRPVVYDCHDLGFYHKLSVSEGEAFAFAHADAMVHVSREQRDVAYSLHPWTCPDVVVLSCPPRAWAPRAGGPRSGVVYEGGLVRPGLGRMDWRDLSPVTSAFAQAGVPLDLYVRRSMARYYPNVKGRLPYGALLRALTRYQFGWVGTDAPVKKGMAGVPNKLWDYAAAGVVPIICNRLAALAAFGAGALVATSAADALEQLRSVDPESLRRRIRPRYMDDEIGVMVSMYEALA